MATLPCFLLRLDLSHSGAAPSISALYHLDELRISFGAVKLLPIITLPGYRCRPFSTHRTDMSSESDNDREIAAARCGLQARRHYPRDPQPIRGRSGKGRRDCLRGKQG